MRCARCGTDVPSLVPICPSCGTRLPSQSDSPAQAIDMLRINASDVVLMFGDRFAEQKEDGYKVPCSGVEVGFSSLVVAAFTAALASLSREGLIGVARGQKKGFLFKADAAFIRKEKDPAVQKGGLEGRILANLLGDPAKDSVRDVLRRCLGQSTMDPYTVIISQIMEHAEEAGFFVKDENAPPIVKFLAGRTLATPLSPLCDRIAEVAGDVAGVRALLDAFKAKDQDLFALIGSDIKKSINAAYIQT